MNRARSDLCGGCSVMGVSTAMPPDERMTDLSGLDG